MNQSEIKTMESTDLTKKYCKNCGHEVKYDEITKKVYHFRRENSNVSYIKGKRDIYTKKCVVCIREHKYPKCLKPDL